MARRAYSVDKGDKSLFLSNLMQRIDNINTRTKEVAEERAKIKPTHVSGKKNFRPFRKAVFEGTQGKVVVKDHPLSKNTFKIMDESNFRNGGSRPNPPSRNAEARKSLSPRNDNSTRIERPRINRPPRAGMPPRAGRPQTSRPPRARRSDDKLKFQDTESVVVKELVVTNYQPKISGDVFFHGKPASLAISTTSRVAAVAKETLIESKYPYKLPKSIIDNLSSDFVGNHFILQKDFNLDVEAAKLGDRISKVVKGNVDTIDVGSKPEATSLFTAAQLARNADLSLAQKQSIYDVASGLKLAKLLVEGAVWNK